MESAAAATDPPWDATMRRPATGAALELRVLEGPQAGAKAPLPLGGAIVIAITPDGAADDADLVLRDESAPATRLRVQAGLPLAALQVLAGKVQLGDRTLDAGSEADWTMYAPLRSGALVLAFGAAGGARWKPAAADGDAAAPAAAAPAPPPAPTPPLQRRAEVWLAALGVGVLLVCAAALSLPGFAARPQPAAVADLATQARSLNKALKGSEFAALEVGADEGRLQLRGRLATQADRLHLDAWLARQGTSPRIDVRVDELLALEVAEVFRIHGIVVRTRVTGPGRVLAEAAEPDRSRLDRTAEVVRRDVRGLAELSTSNSAAPAPPARTPLPDEPGKRIASVVPGSPSYLVTADGARYFIGALLPSGHRITQIAQASVTLERDGQTSTLNF